ncbi:MAG: 3'-5' exonuclease [Boseongicola sp. SB0667_bin_21]|nr:3'-5' exonuclease [Boseongicola sp. SB0667_bin_21]
MTNFAAIDFETADYHSDSACSVGVVHVKDNSIAERYHRLIRPPRREFVFTYIHGLTWNDVRDSPSFGELWPELRHLLDRADFLVAHNASFDSRVLGACCRLAGISPPRYRFLCTVSMARKMWKLRSARLPVVCQHLGIALEHHDALSDAEACAKIAMRALG